MFNFEGPGASGSMIRNRTKCDATGGGAKSEAVPDRSAAEQAAVKWELRLGTSKHKGQRRPIAERHGGIAQLGEHLLCKQGVKGSNPFISTIWADSSAG